MVACWTVTTQTPNSTCPNCPSPYGVLWGTHRDRQARKLSKTKSSSVVPEAPFGLEKEVHHRVYALIQVQGCSCSKLEALETYKEHSVI